MHHSEVKWTVYPGFAAGSDSITLLFLLIFWPIGQTNRRIFLYLFSIVIVFDVSTRSLPRSMLSFHRGR